MIIVKVNDGESIERALRRYKRKFDHTGILKQVRKKMHYRKPSEEKIEMTKKAVNRQKYYARENY
ncbi:MAG: 30S ribosomal protein S21 [Bacteroidetes bacterium]|nr:30S ribosomal protein S21 [Bacteroidota bacterium]MCB0845342.1 30S ribosomal protein S21 [Bacteroidota bacterium]MCB0855848.1 30S ribosomal protein S21 [Bacteroidota bacterium]